MKPFYSHGFRLGILGGGQLGRMLLQECAGLDVRTHVLDPSPQAPCAHLCHRFFQGDLTDFQRVVEFGKTCDVLTIEIEHVNADALRALEEAGVAVYPSSHILRTIQDKGLQKQFYAHHGIPTAPFELVSNGKQHRHWPVVQKLRTGGYDGKGVQIIRSQEDLAKAFDGPCVVEECVTFSKELAVIVSRNIRGETAVFPLVEMEFNPEANLVEFLFSPANVSPDTEAEAKRLALQIVDALDFVGLLAVEMFMLTDGSLLVNEMAPRPHNSGHHTIEACATSQYAQHLRAILGLPPGDTRQIRPAVMVNLLGADGHSGPVRYEGLEEILAMPGVYVHLYGKAETRPFRKMGHVTVCADRLETAMNRARQVLQTLRVEGE
jgi:5-(carboxyamino)imidazole ribonucleotide synthase